MSTEPAPGLDRGSRPAPFALLLACVFAAGVASLLYEVLWVRQLGLSLGSTAIATSVMLSAFLGGLALGSTWMGRRADDLNTPSRVLLWVELGAAVLGVAAIPALEAAGHAYVFLAMSFGLTGVAATVMRVLFSLVVMLIPATLFGMTFPLVTAQGARFVRGAMAAGVVSAISSFGSATGALLCGLWLEPALGIFRSALVGAACNVIAGGLAWLVGKLSDV